MVPMSLPRKALVIFDGSSIETNLVGILALCMIFNATGSNNSYLPA